MSETAPSLSVCVASHDRPLRLRWLLNALHEQELSTSEWEIVVAHDSRGPETARLLRDHPLARAGVLHALELPPHPGAADKRNAAWRAARAPHVLFTDDDCRPPRDWLANALAAVRRRPEAIVQGATQPDPDELALVHVAGWRSIQVEPPVTWAQTCNIVYPRAVLEAVGGFDEALATTEDTDLALRARAAGASYVGDPAMRTFHCVEVLSLPARVRHTQRWVSVPRLVGRHPELRRSFPLRVFWKPRHALFGPALVGGLLAAGGLRRSRAGHAAGGSPPARRLLLGLALVAPWARAAAPAYGPGPRGRLRAAIELPGAALVDAGEITACVRGSIRHGSLVL